jgi:hypothetical protein
MRRFGICILAAGLLPVAGRATTYTVERGSDLQAVIDHAADGDTLRLGARTFEAHRNSFTDPLCGNCGNPQTEAKTTRGFEIRGKGLVIVGQSRNETVLVTHAGYGVYFEDASRSELHNLTVTGGVRSDDGNATDAAVVVRRSRVTLDRVTIRDNADRSSDSSVVVGIAGVVGREGAEIAIHRCSVLSGGWDGVALYRGAHAEITDCVIKDGRGAGIGVTWDADCVALRNDISGYWKGLGSFGTTSVIARNNLIHDNLGWGLIATAQSTMDATNNVIYHNGNCGFAPWSSEARGRFINNIVADNGWRDQWVCPCVGVWNYGDWAKWTFRNNVVWNNKAGNYEGIWDQADINGNLGVDPMFVGNGDFHLQDGSPALHAGDSTIFNLDGSRSNIGLYGGPGAGR